MGKKLLCGDWGMKIPWPLRKTALSSGTSWGTHCTCRMNDSLLNSYSLSRLLLGLCLHYPLSLSLSHIRTLTYSRSPLYTSIIRMLSFICTKGDFHTAERRGVENCGDDSNPKIRWWPIYIISLQTLDMSEWKYEAQIRAPKEYLCLWSDMGSW